MADFDIERFVSLSRAIDLSDIDWAECRRIGISDDEYRAIRFMSDIESHTIIYLRDLLAGHTAADPEVMAFLSCWVYEETHHGRALDRLIAESGRPADAERYRKVTSQFSFREELTGVLSRLTTTLSPHFGAAHMCWGAINEHVAAATYLGMARRSKNPALVTILTRMAKDERKHFSFYFHQAEKRLKSGGRGAEWLCSTAIRRFWKPVGIGIPGGPEGLEFAASYVFGDDRGKADLLATDKVIRELPGMGWFDMVSRWQLAAEERYRADNPAEYQRHRDVDRARAARAAA
jgi:rubrerythrin